VIVPKALRARLVVNASQAQRLITPPLIASA